jgi:hypothetical protein
LYYALWLETVANRSGHGELENICYKRVPIHVFKKINFFFVKN